MKAMVLRPSFERGLTAAPQDEERHTFSLASRNIWTLAKAAGTGQEIGWEEETPAESQLTIKGKAYIAGIYEHPTRHAPTNPPRSFMPRSPRARSRTPA